MAEYIFEINEALYDEATGDLCVKPEFKGKLIRCKDCKWWNKNQTGELKACSNVGGCWAANEFCSDAVHREDGENE